MKPDIVKLARLKTAEDLLARADALGIALPFQPEGAGSALSQTVTVGNRLVGNRWAILPMEGWDGDRSGRPTDAVHRRWKRFGQSGAKLIWGGEAVAVHPDGRANPNQLISNDANQDALRSLRETLVSAHAERFGSTNDLLVGLQLTHSGRFARPDGTAAPRVAYRHPILDARVGVADDDAILSDAELDALVLAFVEAAKRAQQAGFDFVDVKHCHGYLGHELLTAVDRPGPYGGDLAGRTHFLRQICDGIRNEAPGLDVGVRLSLFDFVPYRPGEDGVGVCESCPEGGEYRHAFGGDGSGEGTDLAETHEFLSMLPSLGVRLVCTTAGSPYYVPHIQRPALYPPSDGYRPPEDPLVGVARQISATSEVCGAHPDLLFVGSGYTYLQEWLPHVAEAVIAGGGADFIGLGRMALSYPDLPVDAHAAGALDKGRICRTFSDCTTAPRNGLVSGCFPLDPFYRESDAYAKLTEIKRRQKD